MCLLLRSPFGFLQQPYLSTEYHIQILGGVLHDIWLSPVRSKMSFLRCRPTHLPVDPKDALLTGCFKKILHKFVVPAVNDS